MEMYRTPDNHVAKYVHDDGSETAIKTIPDDTVGGTYGNVRNKYNVFISFSVGCPVGCTFCYLTTKKCPTFSLSKGEIVKNVLDALCAEVEERPELRQMYLKLSWMGMGDPFFDIVKAINASGEILNDAINKLNLAKGLDGIDFATTLPKFDDSMIHSLSFLNNSCVNYSLNPQRPHKRQGVRVFYSLHGTDDTQRRELIPHTTNLFQAMKFMEKLSEKVEVVYHYMFLDKHNDSPHDLEYLKEMIPDGAELRLLRFNQCEGTTFKETQFFNNIVRDLHNAGMNLKVQASPGSEVKAACGQFLLSKIIPAGENK